jgi:hypothetical protein
VGTNSPAEISSFFGWDGCTELNRLCNKRDIPKIKYWICKVLNDAGESQAAFPSDDLDAK